jgi:ABC-type Na+ efflux pump permease subunit
MVIASREFGAAVKSKAFVISLVLMPLMMFGGIFVQRMTEKIADVKDKRIAVIDRSPGGEVAVALERAAKSRIEAVVFNESGKQVKPKILVEIVPPLASSDEGSARQQRLVLSDRVRSGELFAIVEIGKDVLRPNLEPTTRRAELAREIAEAPMMKKMELADEMIGENNGGRYSTNKPTNAEVRDFLQATLNQEVYRRRMELAGLPFAQVMPLLTPPRLVGHGLTRQNSAGQILDADRQNEIMQLMVPLGMLMLMFIVVMVGASPMTGNMIEEKQLRIAEVLLGSVSPFQLMMGKLIGGAMTALTLAAIYFAGAYWIARQADVAHMISAQMIVWFIIFAVIATFMYGAMFVAAGAAVTNIKEAQTLITPIMLVIVLPMFVLGNLLKDPSGMLAQIATYFPTSAPMVTVARLGIPPGMPAWQAILAAAVAILTTIALVWAAGRIFRVGILMQGQAPKPMELMKWVFRG